MDNLNKSFAWIADSFIALLIAMVISSSCRLQRRTNDDEKFNDTLRIGTLYGPTSYFKYRDEEMGYEYEMARAFAQHENRPFAIHVASDLDSLILLLNMDSIHLIAYEVPITPEYASQVKHVGPEVTHRQVLIQRTNGPDPVLKNVNELIGRDIYIARNAELESRLRELNRNLGGGIRIHTLDTDTMISASLIEQVAKGNLSLTVMDNNIAKWENTYYGNLDFSVPIGIPQRYSWAVKIGNEALAKLIDHHFNDSVAADNATELLIKYFEMSKTVSETEAEYELSLHPERISRYDDIFRKYAKEIGWDWRLLAAQGYTESKFRTDAKSWAGARGIMQLMPATAAYHGASVASLSNPDTNIKTAVKAISTLEKIMSRYIEDPLERRKFILAAYNSGIGHILDAIALAKKYGMNPKLWDENVETALLMKSIPKYYNDPAVKNGYFRGKETVNYVANVGKIYELYARKVKH